MLTKDFNQMNRTYQWPDNYYMETDPAQRKRYLEYAMKEDASPENKLRLQLWTARYTDARGKMTGTDYYMKGWMNLEYQANHKKGLFGARKSQKEIDEFFHSFQLNELASLEETNTSEGSSLSKIWYREYLHFCSFYIQISINDKTYSTGAFGIGKLSESSLSGKLAADLCRKTIILPQKLGFYDKQLLLAQAAKDAFALYYPDEVSMYEKTANDLLKKASDN